MKYIPANIKFNMELLEYEGSTVPLSYIFCFTIRIIRLNKKRYLISPPSEDLQILVRSHENSGGTTSTKVDKNQISQTYIIRGKVQRIYYSS